MNIKDTLIERGKDYGDYKKGCEVRLKILEAIMDSYRYHNASNMPPLYIEFFHDIANKLSRLAVTPNHKDSWHDMVGYTTLIERYIGEEEKDE